MGKYIMKVKRDCDNSWTEFEIKSIEKVKEKLGSLTGEFKYELYQKIETGNFTK